MAREIASGDIPALYDAPRAAFADEIAWEAPAEEAAPAETEAAAE